MQKVELLPTPFLQTPQGYFDLFTAKFLPSCIFKRTSDSHDLLFTHNLLHLSELLNICENAALFPERSHTLLQFTLMIRSMNTLIFLIIIRMVFRSFKSLHIYSHFCASQLCDPDSRREKVDFLWKICYRPYAFFKYCTCSI